MSSLAATSYELRRIVFSRKYLYLTLLLGYVTYRGLTGKLSHGVHGTAPFSRLSYTSFLVSISPFLLVFLMLLCASVFSDREIAARKIIFSTPITPRGYLGIKGGSPSRPRSSW